MAVWPEATHFKTRILTGISLRGIVMVMVTLAVMISEIRFDWVEKVLGSYLATTNTHRPESGNIWEQGRLRKVAAQTLERITTDQITVQREVREATSLTQLVERLSGTRGITVSAEWFKQLYGKIPEVAARAIFSPAYMLRISAEKSWDRVYLERENDRVGIYLLDHGNHVINYTTINSDQLALTGEGSMQVISGSVSDYPEFSGRIYPAARFFMALDTLPPETQQSILSWPGPVLAMEGTPVRVGISDEVRGTVIPIAIEMETPLGPQVVMATGQEWAVLEVRSLLEPSLVRTTLHTIRVAP
ncbi:hypothetical protein LJC41_08425 [Desulfosarcina sp. OttesenSCG-928-G17]|nr:hypothetical protein [Desulfosarcina sp. OttesenSCG-928-G17]